MLKASTLKAYEHALQREEMAPATIERYLRGLWSFLLYAHGRELTQELTLSWKEYLQTQGYGAGTINVMLVALNGLLEFLERRDCRVKLLRRQRRLFRGKDRELDQSEYNRLVSTAKNQGKERLALLMEAICSTGIRVSEVHYITVEALSQGFGEIRLKGKIRTVLFPNKLAKKLLRYAKRQGIESGEVFRTRTGRGLDRRQIWSEMKQLCRAAGVEPGKVFPHNLRHLFARTYYKADRDIVHLADVLGHSSIETTRIYLLSTGEEQRRKMEGLRLIS